MIGTLIRGMISEFTSFVAVGSFTADDGPLL